MDAGLLVAFCRQQPVKSSTTVRGSNVDVPLTERLLNEIRAYEQIPMPNVAHFDPLKWWGEQHVQYSLLSIV